MQEEADRRSAQGGDPVRKKAWAPVLAESGTRLRDIHVECEENDPQRVWRLETLLAAANATASEQERWNEMLHDSLTKKGVTIGRHEGEIERLQEENERLRDESAVAKENERLRAERQEGEIERLQDEIERLRDESAVAKENERLRVKLLLAGKAAANVAELVEGLELALRCPISVVQMVDPVVSIYGHSYSRGDIEKWLKKKSTCPMTGQRLRKEKMPTNRALADVADAFNAYQAGQAQ
jgi:hypothetical protein